MNSKKINWGLSIIVIVTLGSFLWTTWNDIEEDNFMYGKDFNETRDSLGIPKIEENWITHKSNQYSRFWTHPGRVINTIEPHHSSKTSKFDGNNLASENDDFHWETNDSLAFRVVYEYYFADNKWDCRFIKYRKGKYPPTESWGLTLNQADSVINKWGLRR